MPLESDKVVALRRLLAAGAVKEILLASTSSTSPNSWASATNPLGVSFFHRLKYHVSSLSQDVTSTSPTKTIVTAIMVN